MWLPTGLCRLCAGSLTLWGNDNEGNKLNSTKTFAVWEIEKWDRFYSKWEVQGRSWGCRIWIGMCVCLFMYVCVKRLFLWRKGLGTKCLALQVCAPVVVRTCEAFCGGGYVTVVMIGCGRWRHECICVSCCRQVLAWWQTYTHTHKPVHTTMYLISDFISHAVQAIRCMTSGRVSTCQVRRAKFFSLGSDNPQPSSSVWYAGA